MLEIERGSQPKHLFRMIAFTRAEQETSHRGDTEAWNESSQVPQNAPTALTQQALVGANQLARGGRGSAVDNIFLCFVFFLTASYITLCT